MHLKDLYLLQVTLILPQILYKVSISAGPRGNGRKADQIPKESLRVIKGDGLDEQSPKLRVILLILIDMLEVNVEAGLAERREGERLSCEGGAEVVLIEKMCQSRLEAEQARRRLYEGLKKQKRMRVI